MSEFDFKPTASIFRNRDALTEHWTPDELVGRDEELREYHTALQPVIENEIPSNVFLYGKSGVGKTAATRFLLERLQRDAANVSGLDFHTIEINCDGLNSSYQTAVQLVNQLRPPRNQISDTGHPQAAVYRFLFEELDDLGGTVLIVLDEVDHINDDSLLYKLPRARSNSDVENVKLGVIGISNDLTFREQLSSKVRSSLCEKEVSFSAYDAQELQQVLHQRVDVAFEDDVLDKGVIQLCSAFGAKDSGDARQALDLLLEAGDIARAENADTVTETHVDQAREKLQTDQVEEGISNFPEHGQYVLYALTLLHEDEQTPAKTKEVREIYKVVCDRQGMEPISTRSVREHLAELSQLGIISSTIENRGVEGGKFKKHSLDQPVKSIRVGLTTLSEE